MSSPVIPCVLLLACCHSGHVDLVQLSAEATAHAWGKNGALLFICDSEGAVHVNVMETDPAKQEIKPITTHAVRCLHSRPVSLVYASAVASVALCLFRLVSLSSVSPRFAWLCAVMVVERFPRLLDFACG